MLRIEASFSGGKSGLLVKFLNFGVELVEHGAQRVRQRIRVRDQRGPVRPEDPEIELGVEERDFETVAGDRVAMRLRDSMNESLQAEASKIVGHLGGGVGATEQCFD